MLVLSRKCGEVVEIGQSIKVTVVRLSGNLVRLGIEAPRDVPICRPEAVRKLALPAASGPQQDEGQHHDLRRPRILVVDDSLEDRQAYRRFMSFGETEYEVAETDSGEDGLALCRSQPPDCVLLDYCLPDLNGLEFLAELSRPTGELPVPVVMLTGHGDELIAVQAMKQGAFDYIVKRNVTRDGLRAAIDATLAKFGARHARA